jgi:hypothetical protein
VSLEGKGWESFGKKASGRNKRLSEGMALEDSFFSVAQNLSHLRGGFWRVYMNYANSIYVVIIFLKLKRY